MQPKNRKFNIAGVSFYRNDVEEDELVFFGLEPDNPHDKNAIKVLNQGGQILGYIPKDSALEIHGFLNGKYPYYCAKVVEIWELDDGDFVVPKILAHFANKSSELPFASQERESNLHGLSRKPTTEEVDRNRKSFLFLIIGVLLFWGLGVHFSGDYVISTLLSGIVLWIGIKWLIRDR
jgi:hypothetical protein